MEKIENCYNDCFWVNQTNKCACKESVWFEHLAGDIMIALNGKVCENYELYDGDDDE